MRVLLATDVFPPRCGGSGWSTYHLARALRERGHAVAIVRASLDLRRADEYEYDGFRVQQIAVLVPPAPVVRNVAKNEIFWALAGRRLAEIGRDWQADLIHGQHVMSIPAAVRAGRSLGRPVVATVRDYWPTCPISTRLRPEGICPRCSTPRLAQCLADHQPVRLPLVALFQGYVQANRHRRQMALHAADRVIAVSQFVADDLRIHAGVEAQVLPNMIDVPEMPPPPPEGWPRDRPYTIFVGKLDHHKAADRLPALVAACERPVDLVVIGDGPLRQTLTAECAARGVRLHHLPVVPNSEVTRWLAHARALLFPARWPEPLSRVLLEAVSVGCPIIATPTGGTPDTIADGISGFLTDDPTAAAARLRQLIDDEALWRRAGQAARQLASERFATSVVLGRVEALYASLLTGR